jgi:two-component system chemotaxis sensor kinase CheA
MPDDGNAFEIDPTLLQDFVAESREALGEIGPLLVRLEDAPDDQGVLDAIFRPFHSIKGNSSFFGLTHIKTFSHRLENLLQAMRSHEMTADKAVIDALLRGTDMLTDMLDRLASGDASTDLQPEEEALLDEVNDLREGGAASAAESLERALKALQRLHSEAPAALGDDLRIVDEALQKSLGTLQPAAATAAADRGVIRYSLGGADVTETMNRLHQFLHGLEQEAPSGEAVDAFLDDLHTLDEAAAALGEEPLQEAVASMRDDFLSIHESGIGFDDLLTGLLHEKLDAVASFLTRESAEAGGAPAPDAEEAPAAPVAEKAGDAESRPAPKPADSGGKTIRIAEEKVDAFMNYVGELIVTSEVLAYLQKRLDAQGGVRDIANEFKKAVQAFNDLSFSLQRSLMAVRRVPLKGILQKLPRVVRDLADGLDKEVDLEIRGESVQIDKSLVEALESPVTHMVRNAVDHAIEDPDTRREAGKPETGTVSVEAECDEETFTLTIRDDGKGLDAEAIKAKAVSNGVLSRAEADAMSDREAFKLIFAAGFSTAEKVTDVSGRGVGMDVVRTNVEELNGEIEIDSTPGEGTVFRIRLPMTVTLLVVDGLLASVAETTYIIPLEDVLQSVKPRREDCSTISGKGEVVNVRGRLYPLIRLRRVFGAEGPDPDPWETIVVLAETDAGHCALLIDELIGQQSVVLKDLSDHFERLEILRGGAILGNGRVGLVLAVDAILQQNHHGDGPRP